MAPDARCEEFMENMARIERERERSMKFFGWAVKRWPLTLIVTGMCTEMKITNGFAFGNCALKTVDRKKCTGSNRNGQLVTAAGGDRVSN